MEILLSTPNIIQTVDVVPDKKFSMANRSNFAAGIYNNTLLIIGGVGGTSSPLGTYPTQCEKVDLVAGTITRVSLGAAFTWCTGVASGNNLYFFDGHNGNYNSLNRRALIEGTTTFTSLTAIPTPYRHSSVAVLYNGKIYRINGYTGSTTKSCNVYDIAANSWTSIASPPYSCNGHAAGAYNGKIYVFCGWTDDLSKSLNIVQIYDIATNTWSIETPFQGVTLAWGSGCAYDHYFFYISATKNDVNSYTIRRYDLNNLMKPHKEFIVRNTTRRYASTTLIDPVRNRLLVAGGCQYSPGTANYDNLDKINYIDCFNLATLLA